jgi:hypothetical protein
MIPRLVALCVFVAALAFLLGFATAVRLHGNWIVMRDTGGCVAYDPDVGRNVARWGVGTDDRCHLGDLLWSRLL